MICFISSGFQDAEWTHPSNFIFPSFPFIGELKVVVYRQNPIFSTSCSIFSSKNGNYIRWMNHYLQERKHQHKHTCRRQARKDQEGMNNINDPRRPQKTNSPRVYVCQVGIVSFSSVIARVLDNWWDVSLSSNTFASRLKASYVRYRNFGLKRTL